MPALKRNTLLCLSATLLLGAFTLEFMPTNALYSKLLGQKELNGFQSSLSLMQYKMLNQNSEPVTWESYANNPLFVTTGFTNCPHSCPMTMAIYQQLAQELPVETQFALLTIDPENDTPKVLTKYLNSINPRFIGLYIKDESEFKRIIKDLKQSVQNLPGKQDIIHSDFVYLLHPKIEGLIIYANPNVAEISQDLIRINQI